MKTPGLDQRRPAVRKRLGLLVVALLLVFCLAGAVQASSGGEGGTKGWVATDTYRVMNFAVLAIALFLLLRKPVTQALDARIKGIKDQLGELETRKKEAEKQLADYSEKLTQLDQEAERLIAEYIRQGNEAKEKILAEARLAADRLEEQARRNIEHEFKTAKAKLQEEVLDKAMAQAEAMIKAKITAEDQEKLVDEYLE